MSLKEKLRAAGADKLCDILLSLRDKNKDLHSEIDKIMAGLDENPKKMASIIRKEIAAFKRSVRDVTVKESKPLSERLDNLRLRIANDLFSKSPKMAFEFMLEFLDLHENTLERSDDSHNNIGEVFTSSCKDLGKISEKISLSQPQLVEIVFSKYMENRYCICDNIIIDFENSLTNEGLLMLKGKFESVMHSGESTSHKRSQARYGLLSVADVIKDVDFYIAACSNTVGTSNQVHEKFYHTKIASRLIKHGRGQEALDWLNRDKTDTSPTYCKLRVQAYESIGEHDKAQTERLIWFDKNLRADAYRDILTAASSEFKSSFRTEAMQKTFSYPDPHVALSFLMEVKELEELKKFIRLRHKSLSGMDHRLLKPVLDRVHSSDPLAATLVYRSIVAAVLNAGKRSQYKLATNYLLRCSILSSKITNWESFENHFEYLGSIQKAHKYKRSFWSEYEFNLNSVTLAKKRRIV